MFQKMNELNYGIILTGHGGDQIFGGLNWTINAAKDHFLKKLLALHEVSSSD